MGNKHTHTETIRHVQDPKLVAEAKRLGELTQQQSRDLIRIRDHASQLDKKFNDMSNVAQNQQNEIQQQERRIQSLNREMEDKAQKITEMTIDNELKYGIIRGNLFSIYNLDTLIGLGFNPKEFNIGIIGRVSSGKSTIITACLNLTGENRAKSGHGETTMVPKAYRTPNMLNIAAWDFPGVGGTRFDYTKSREYIFLLSKMDVLLVVFDGVADQSARQTFNFVKEMPNTKLFIYNKIEEICENLQLDEEFQENAALKQLEIEAKIIGRTCNAEMSFLISAKNINLNRKNPRIVRDEYDWEILKSCLESVMDGTSKGQPQTAIETKLQAVYKEALAKKQGKKTQQEQQRRNSVAGPLLSVQLHQCKLKSPKPITQPHLDPDHIRKSNVDDIISRRQSLKSVKQPLVNPVTTNNLNGDHDFRGVLKSRSLNLDKANSKR